LDTDGQNENNIKIDFGEISYKDGNCIEEAKDRVNLQAFVSQL
jgi:hypothetical protein